MIKKKELNLNELDNATGGALIGNINDDDSIENLKVGDELILEDKMGKDLAKVIYNGSSEYHKSKRSYWYTVMCTVAEIYVDEIEDYHHNTVNVGQTAEFCAQDLDYFENR